MPSIKSDLMNKNYSAPKMRQIEVSDESFDDEELYDYNQDDSPPDLSNADVDAINAHLRSRGLPPLDNMGAREENRQAPRHNSIQSVENKISEARKLKVSGKERLGEAAKRRIEMLCGLFNNVKEVNLDGQVFILRTLKGKEIKQSLAAAYLHEGTIELPFETRKQFLARSLVEISGTSVDMFLGDNSIEARCEFIEDLPEPILGALYAAYLELVNDTNKKYSVNSEMDAQEVAADLKK